MIEIQKNISLAQYTSWLVGGPADNFVMPTSTEELKEALVLAAEGKMDYTLVGGGSNVLISDKGVRGLTICLRKFSGLTVLEENNVLKIRARSGTSKSELLKTFLKYKLAPALFLAGIPGDVGGGVVMNAGVGEMIAPREFGELVEWVDVLKPVGLIKRYQHDEVQWSYRHSKGWEPGIIIDVGLQWPLEQDLGILEKVKETNRLRLSKQPLDMPSCGSVFINPPEHKAAQLIEACGLKGYCVGGAEVSKKHANFIVNTGSAKASEIWQVIEHVRATVLKEKAVDLKTEVVRLGEWPAQS